MKIFIKSLKGDKTEFEVQLEDTVESLKQKIKEIQGHPPDLQKLIAFGRIMEDAKLLSEYNLKESDNIVLMVAKPKPAPRVQAEPVPQPAQVPSSGAPAVGPPKFGFPAVPGPSPVSPPQPVLQGPEYEANVQRIMELGMPRDQVEAALRAARGIPDLAMEFLLNGIPSAMAGGQPHAHQRGAAAPNNPAVGSDNPFSFLRSNPAMLQIRASVQQNPALLQSLLQQIASTNPQLGRLIAQHQEEFRQFMMETTPQVDPGLVAALPRPAGGVAQPPAAAAPHHGGGGHRLQLSPEENSAIDNLASLGFSKQDALEAYLSCDKNEAMAANLLFENYVPLAVQEEQRAARAAQPAHPPQPAVVQPAQPPSEPAQPAQPAQPSQPPSQSAPSPSTGEKPPSQDPPAGGNPPPDPPSSS